MEIKMVKLIDIAQIRSGYSFREGLSKQPSGTLPVIQFKDMNGLYIDDLSNCTRISYEQIKGLHFLQFRDVLLSNRGNYRATVFNTKQECIASGVFFILTVRNKDFVPEYVATFLNSNLGQKIMSVRQSPTGVQSITCAELRQIDIPQISFEKQKQIVQLFTLYETEENIMEKLKQNTQKLLNLALTRIVQE